MPLLMSWYMRFGQGVSLDGVRVGVDDVSLLVLRPSAVWDSVEGSRGRWWVRGPVQTSLS